VRHDIGMAALFCLVRHDVGMHMHAYIVAMPCGKKIMYSFTRILFFETSKIF
jgi:hypothetical protein